MVQATTLPIPSRGLNTRDSVDSMEPGFATLLTNWLPINGVLRLRGGSIEHAPLTSGLVETLIPHTNTDGTRRLISAVRASNNSTVLYDVTAQGNPNFFAGSFTNSSARYYFTQLDGVTVICNGDRVPRYFTATGAPVACAFTGVPDQTLLQHVSSYKGRLYFTLNSSIWYGPDGAFTGGALVELPVGKLFSLGGTIAFTAGWTRDTGNNSTEAFVVMSTQGELLLFTGLFPGSPDWKLEGKFYLGPPFGRRSHFNMGSDLIILTRQGIFPLTTVLSSGQANVFQAISSAIQPSFISDAEKYGNNYGWDAFFYAPLNCGIVNVPVSVGVSHQYAVNVATGAWAKLEGLNGISWACYSDSLYLGNSFGDVLRAEQGSSDLGSPILAKCHWAYDYLGTRSNQKSVKELRPILNIRGSVTLDASVSVDYKPPTSKSTITITGSGTKWNTAKWNTAKWARGEVTVVRPIGVAGVGFSIQPRIEGAFNSNSCSITALGIHSTIGGVR